MTTMQEIAISVFKAKCLAILEQVEKTKTPIRITRHGKPVADVVPTVPNVDRAALFGSMRNSIEILGDIVSPVIDLDEIEALRD
jgi:prevent-host-death family protein